MVDLPRRQLRFGDPSPSASIWALAMYVAGIIWLVTAQLAAPITARLASEKKIAATAPNPACRAVNRRSIAWISSVAETSFAVRRSVLTLGLTLDQRLLGRLIFRA